MILEALIRAGSPKQAPVRHNAITVSTPGVVTTGLGSFGAEQAKRLSAIYRAIDVRSGDISLMPAFVMDRR